MSDALHGFRIAVPESRELDLFAAMLERQGASTLRCPLVTIRDVEDAAPVERWLHRLAGGGHDDLVFLTGEGVTRLLGFAERAGIRDAAIEGMRRARKVVRGPKPARALREAGLEPDLPAEQPTTEGVIASLSKLELRGRCVGVQLYPDNPNERLMDFLREAGAKPDSVLCYRYASQEEDGHVADLIRAMAEGSLDLIAFTSTPQIRRLRDVARRFDLETQLGDALRKTPIAAIGPVTAEAVEQLGARVSVMPQSKFHLKPFVAEIVALLKDRKPHAAASG
jgi:uroporphyrinogen-III synthase